MTALEVGHENLDLDDKKVSETRVASDTSPNDDRWATGRVELWAFYVYYIVSNFL